MRRFLPVVLVGLWLYFPVFGQVVSPVQVGKATQELKDSGLSAAHFNLPLGTKVKIANAETGREIEVTIKGRIPLSPNRIVDLSPSAWSALALRPDTDVRLTPPPPAGGEPVRTTTVTKPPPAAEENKEGDQWFTIQVHPEASPVSAWEIRIIAGDEQRQLTIQGRPSQPRISGGDTEPPSWEESFQDEVFLNDADQGDEEEDEANAAEEDFTSLVLTRRVPIKVVPGLPSPNSRKTYRLQVGAYARTETANIAERELKAAGFTTMRETRGSLCRVLAAGIPAAEVKSAVQKIESAGFGEVWVRE